MKYPKFFETSKGPSELLGSKGEYLVFVSQEDIKKMLDKDTPEKEVSVVPIVIKGNNPFKHINGNVARKMKLLTIPEMVKDMIISNVMFKLSNQETKE